MLSMVKSPAEYGPRAVIRKKTASFVLQQCPLNSRLNCSAGDCGGECGLSEYSVGTRDGQHNNY